MRILINALPLLFPPGWRPGNLARLAPKWSGLDEDEDEDEGDGDGDGDGVGDDDDDDDDGDGNGDGNGDGDDGDCNSDDDDGDDDNAGSSCARDMNNKTENTSKDALDETEKHTSCAHFEWCKIRIIILYPLFKDIFSSISEMVSPPCIPLFV